jgi:Ni/Co efflux regulator RcnB
MRRRIATLFWVAAWLVPVATALAQEPAQRPRDLEKEEKRQTRTEEQGKAKDKATEREFLTDEEKETEYAPKNNSFTFGAHLHSYGIGIDFQYRRQFYPRYELLAATTIGNIKDPGEVTVGSLYGFAGYRDYVADKQNYFYPWWLGVGVQRILIPRSEFSRVQFKMGLTAGPVMGIVKPYLLDVILGPRRLGVRQYQGQSADVILGESDWFQGFDRITVIWGMRYRLEASLDLSGSSWFVRAVQFGIQADVYPREVPLVFAQPNSRVFFGGFLGINIGNGW